ncbi:hypothetical protein Tsubulata_012317 [Turnera subulata]|uniref:Uncharacterized protein n=1 Tax=Turnera subulata TaxID=218843 RepID=A0A9Q0JR54_9ROSI|nr:hypothetical protein Tsubulata_012317 [Turnera subulata]
MELVFSVVASLEKKPSLSGVGVGVLVAAGGVEAGAVAAIGVGNEAAVAAEAMDGGECGGEAGRKADPTRWVAEQRTQVRSLPVSATRRRVWGGVPRRRVTKHCPESEEAPETVAVAVVVVEGEVAVRIVPGGGGIGDDSGQLREKVYGGF